MHGGPRGEASFVGEMKSFPIEYVLRHAPRRAADARPLGADSSVNQPGKYENTKNDSTTRWENPSRPNHGNGTN